MQKFLVGAVVMLIGVSVVTAEEFFGSITKVDGNKISVTKRKRGEKEGENLTLTVADNVKVVKGKFNKEEKKLEAGDALEGGLKNAQFSKERTFALIITNGENAVTEIRVSDFGGFRKKKTDNNK